MDLAILAGLHPSGVLCELVNDDGTVQRLPQLEEFRRRFGLKMISIAQLIEHRARRDHLVELVCTRPFPSEFGEFTLHLFRSTLDQRHHLALTVGTLGPEPTLVRVHSENLLGDVFRLRTLDTQKTLAASLEAIARAGRGAVLYMEHANSDADLIRRLDARPGEGPPPMSFRDYGTGAQILVALGLRKIRLLSNSSRKVVGLDGYGIEIIERCRWAHHEPFRPRTTPAFRRSLQGGGRGGLLQRAPGRRPPRADRRDTGKGGRRSRATCVVTGSRVERAAGGGAAPCERAARTSSWRSASSSAATRSTTNSSPRP